MAIDLKARRISVNFPGGSLTGPYGLIEAVFGQLVAESGGNAEPTQVQRGAYSIQRVIGGPTTSVAGSTYTLKKYPKAVNGGAAGGEAIKVLHNGDWWTLRLSGSHQDFNAWCENAVNAGGIGFLWKSERGTSYGPFGQTA